MNDGNEGEPMSRGQQDERSQSSRFASEGAGEAMDGASLKPQGQVVLQTAADVDAALKDWRQGDCVLRDQWFVHRFDPALPLTAEARGSTGEDVNLVESEVVGMAVVSQTCDIARSCGEERGEPRPFVEACPLVEVPEETLESIKRRERPRYAYLPALAERRLVVDLDRTMTYEKSVIAKWHRTPGLSSDEDARDFARALARKRNRPAFPDQLVRLLQPLRDTIKKKHGKETPEGLALRSLREIRASARPNWDAPVVRVHLWFIYSDEDSKVRADWSDLVAKWLAVVPGNNRFEIEGSCTQLGDMTGADYVFSEPLDFDHISITE